MFVLKFFGLVAAVAVVVNALPSPQSTVPKQLTEEEQQAQEDAFLALPFQERLAVYADHKIYRPMGTVKCVRECIEAASNTNSTHTAYPIHDATYGYVCRDRETEGVLTLWLRDQVGPCIEKKKTEEDTDDLAEDNSPCFSAFDYFEDKIGQMCSYLQQDFSDAKPEETWM